MKKNTIKAMALGLSAVTLASSMDLTAFAEEQSTAVDPKEATAEADAIEKATESTAYSSEESEAIDTLASDLDIAGEFSTEVTAVDTAFDELENGTDKIEVTVTDGNGNEEKKTVEATTSAEDSLDEVATDLSTMATEKANADTAATNADAAVSNADTASITMESTAKNAQEVAEAAEETVVASIEAGDKDTAANAIISATETVEDAEDEFDSAEATYLAALAAYNTAKSNYDTAVTNFEKAQDDADVNLENAEKKLTAAKEALDALQIKVQDAAKTLASDGAGAIAAAQYNRDNNASWSNQDNYFAAIMKYYYLPYVAGLEGTLVTDSVNCTWTKDSKDESNNYCTVTYKVTLADGTTKEVTEYYNYKLNENGQNVVSSTSDMTIFKKTTTYTYNYVDSNGTVQTQTISQETLDSMLEAGSMVKRYAYTYTNAEGNEVTEYYTEQALKNKGIDTSDCTLTYMYLQNGQVTYEDVDTTVREGNVDIDNDGVDDYEAVKSEETYDTTTHEDETYKVAYFDANGNYVEKYTKASKTYTYTYSGILDASATGYETADAAAAAGKALTNDATTIYGSSTLTALDYWTMAVQYRDGYTKNLDVLPTWNPSSLLSQETWNANAATVKAAYTFTMDNLVNSVNVLDTRNVSSQSDTYINQDYGHWAIDTHGTWKTWKWTTYWVTDGTISVRTGTTTSGHVEVDYEDVTSETVDYKTFWTGLSDLFKRNPTSAEIEASMKAYVESQGGTYLGMREFNFDTQTATVYYVKGNTTTSSTHYTSEEAAKADAQNVANSAAYADGANFATVAKVITDDWYKYNRKYVTKDTKTEDTDCTAAYTYNYDVRCQKADDWSNFYYTERVNDASNDYKYSSIDGYWDEFKTKTSITSGETTVETTLKKFIESARAKYDAYQSLLKEVNAAETKVAAEADNVIKLKDKVDKMTVGRSLDTWTSALKTAAERYTAAKEALQAANDALAAARSAFEAAWPAPTPSASDDDDDTTESASVVTSLNTNETGLVDNQLTVIPAAAVPAAGPARATRTARANAVVADGDGVEIEDETVPQAVEEDKEAKEETVTVDDNETPKAAEESTKMNWWWLILVALAAACGITYKVEKDKKAKAAVEQESGSDK